MSEITTAERLDRLTALVAELLDTAQDHDARLSALQQDVCALFARTNAARASELATLNTGRE